MRDHIRKFQELARKAKQRAKAAKDAETSKTFERLAQGWDYFATQAEKQTTALERKGDD